MRQTFDSLLSYMPGLGHLGVNLLIALAILVVGWIVSIAAGRAVHRLAARSPRIDRTIVPMIHSITVWTIRIFVIIAVLARVGVQTASKIGRRAWRGRGWKNGEGTGVAGTEKKKQE